MSVRSLDEGNVFVRSQNEGGVCLSDHKVKRDVCLSDHKMKGDACLSDHKMKGDVRL